MTWYGANGVQTYQKKIITFYKRKRKSVRVRVRVRAESYWCILHRETAPALFSRVLFQTTAPMGPRSPCQWVPLSAKPAERETPGVSDKREPHSGPHWQLGVVQSYTQYKQCFYHVVHKTKPTLVHAFSFGNFRFNDSMTDHSSLAAFVCAKTVRSKLLLLLVYYYYYKHYNNSMRFSPLNIQTST